MKIQEVNNKILSLKIFSSFDKELIEFILANIYVSVLVIVLAYITKLLLMGSLFVDLTEFGDWDWISSTIQFVFRTLLFLLIWLPPLILVGKKMGYKKDEIMQLGFFNAVIGTIIVLSVFNIY